MLAVNAASGNMEDDILASLGVLGDILKGFKNNGKLLDSAFAIVMFRSSIAFFVWKSE